MQILTVVIGSSLAQGQQVVFEDDFENGNTNGWIFAGPDDTASQGAWEFGDPVGTIVGVDQAQPEDAFQGQNCAFTAQNPFGLIGEHDVDNGIVYLVSPVLDLGSFTSVRLDYVRWYYLWQTDVDVTDFFVVQIRESPTSAWGELERLDNMAPANTWTTTSFLLENYIPLTSTVQVRFGASDGVLPVLGNILEAAIDQVLVIGMMTCQDNTDCGLVEYCGPSGQCLPSGDCDFDGDGDADLIDYHACLGCAGSSAGVCAPCNVAGDESILEDDFAVCLQIMSGPG